MRIKDITSNSPQMIGEIKHGNFCGGYYKPGEVLTPFWELDGWVYRGRNYNDWLHSHSSHDDYFLSWSWKNIKKFIQREIKTHKYIYMGYASCPNLKCKYCGEKVPAEVINKILKTVAKKERSK